jgi:hypothetical protein
MQKRAGGSDRKLEPRGSRLSAFASRRKRSDDRARRPEPAPETRSWLWVARDGAADRWIGDSGDDFVTAITDPAARSPV